MEGKVFTVGASPLTPKYSDTGFPTSSLSNSTYTKISYKSSKINEYK